MVKIKAYCLEKSGTYQQLICLYKLVEKVGGTTEGLPGIFETLDVWGERGLLSGRLHPHWSANLQDFLIFGLKYKWISEQTEKLNAFLLDMTNVRNYLFALVTEKRCTVIKLVGNRATRIRVLTKVPICSIAKNSYFVAFPKRPTLLVK